MRGVRHCLDYSIVHLDYRTLNINALPNLVCSVSKNYYLYQIFFGYTKKSNLVCSVSKNYYLYQIFFKKNQIWCVLYQKYIICTKFFFNIKFCVFCTKNVSSVPISCVLYQKSIMCINFF